MARAVRRRRPRRPAGDLDARRPPVDHQGDPLPHAGGPAERPVLLLPRQQPRAHRLARGRRAARQRPGEPVVLHARAPAAVPRAAQALPPQGQVRQRPRARSSGAAAPARERAPLHLGRRRPDPVRRPRHPSRRAGRGRRAHHAADPPRLTTRPSPWRRPRSWARSEAMDLPQEAGAGDRLRERYRDLQAAGTLRADAAQAAAVAALASARRRARGLRPASAPRRLARPPAQPRRATPGAAPRPLPLRPGRPRQVAVDGPVLRGRAGHGQAPRPFPRLHARDPRPPRPPAQGHGRRRRPARAARRRAARRGPAALLRRVPRPEHRRCDDPRAAVRGAAGARHGGRRDLQLRARAALRGRPQPRPFSPVHRAAARAPAGDRARRRHRLPPRAAARRAGLAAAARPGGRGEARGDLRRR